MLCYTEWATAQTAVNENVHGPSPPDTVTKHTVSKNEHKYSRHEYCNEWKDNWVDKSFWFQLHVFHPDQILVNGLNWAAIICSIHMNKIFIN